MRQSIKVFLLSSLFSPVVFSASCEVDKIQMDDQISKYKAIFSIGCPLGGMDRVYDIIEKDLKTCSAICVYTRRTGRGAGLGTTCHWEKGNWGKTLYCG